MLLLVPHFQRFQRCCCAPGAAAGSQVLISGFSKVKEMAFKAWLGFFAIIITEAADGASFAWLLEGGGY